MSRFFKAIFILLAVTIVLFLSIPIIRIVLSSSFGQLLGAIKDKVVMGSIILTLKMSFLATIIVFLTGIPLAYIIARYNFPFKGLVEGLIDVPIMIPHIAAGIALLLSFSAEGSMGHIIRKLGIAILDNPLGIMLAMMFVSAPYLIDSAKEGFKKIDIRLEHAARTLGAGDFDVFFRLTLPLAKKDIINGALLMWGRGIGEFGAVVILAYHPMTATVMIYDRFTSFGLDYALPVATILIFISMLIFIAIRALNR